MRRKMMKRMAVLLLCALLCIGMMGAAYAAEEGNSPASDFTIQISLPSNWASTTTAVKFSITDKNGTGFASAKTKVEGDSGWQDVTNKLEQWDNRHVGQISISDNCTVYVSVTDNEGRSHTESRYIECFDHTAPTVSASISDQLLRIVANDGQSGVTEIIAGGKNYTNLTIGKLDLPLKDLPSGQISIQAVDAAGNKSKTVQVQNPANQVVSDNQKPSAQVQKPVTTTTTPVTTTPAATPSAPSASTTTPAQSTTTPVTVSKDNTENNTTTGKTLTPDGQGSVVDNVTDEDGKEFFTISTQDDNTFYLVIDKLRGDDNVYFLDTVKESDLLSLAEKDTDEPSQSAIPDPEPVCICIDKCVPGEVKTDCPVCVLALKDCTGKAPAVDPDGDKEPEKPEKSNNSTMILVLIAALAAGGAGYYLKVYKPKHDLDDADDFDDLTGGYADEETINEDDEESIPRHDPYDEPDYPDGYYSEPGDDE